MDNDAEARILLAITNLTGKVEEYHGDFKEHRGATNIRIQSIEESVKEDKKWGSIKTIIVIPVIALLHQVASHFGWIK